MKTAPGLLLAALVFAPAALAADAPEASLFFTPEEVQAVETLAAASQGSAADSRAIHLGAVLYYGPDDWVLWLQNRRWTPATQDPELRVTGVAPDEVRLRLAAVAGAVAREVTLKPYQTLQLPAGRVVEGALAPSGSLSR